MRWPHEHTALLNCALRTLMLGRTLLTQKVLELPSTAMLAPCTAASAVLLAEIAPRTAESSNPADEPF